MDAMSDLLDRTRARLLTGQNAEEPRRLASRAGLAAGSAAATGLALCVLAALVGWLAGSTGTAADATRVGAQVWLLGHGSGLHIGATAVSAIPLGLTMLLALLVWRASVWAASTVEVTDVRAACSGTAIVAGLYATVATAAALFSGTASSGASPVRAFVSALLLAGVSSALGMLRGAGLLDDLWRWLPDHARAALRGGAAAVLALFAAGALLATGALVAGFGEAANIAHAMGAGIVGGAILTMAGVLLLPNAALLAVAYLLGPGFSFGTDTVVAPSGVALGRVPAFPLLAALPDEGAAPVWAPALLAVPVLAGLLAAVVALRHSPVSALDRAALRGGLAGLLAGAATGGLLALAGGSVGPGRMADVGAPVLICTGIAMLAMTLTGVLSGVLVCWRARRR